MYLSTLAFLRACTGTLGKGQLNGRGGRVRGGRNPNEAGEDKRAKSTRKPTNGDN